MNGKDPKTCDRIDLYEWLRVMLKERDKTPIFNALLLVVLVIIFIEVYFWMFDYTSRRAGFPEIVWKS